MPSNYKPSIWTFLHYLKFSQQLGLYLMKYFHTNFRKYCLKFLISHYLQVRIVNISHTFSKTFWKAHLILNILFFIFAKSRLKPLQKRTKFILKQDR